MTTYESRVSKLRDRDDELKAMYLSQEEIKSRITKLCTKYPNKMLVLVRSGRGRYLKECNSFNDVIDVISRMPRLRAFGSVVMYKGKFLDLRGGIRTIHFAVDRR